MPSSALKPRIKALRTSLLTPTSERVFGCINLFRSLIFFNDTATTEIYTLSLHDALPIYHAITRTIPAVDSRFVCSLDPKAVLHCLDVKTGKQLWRKSLVTEYKATIPSWYNGQNPLQEADRLIVATGGSAILVALDKATGKELWH